MSELTPEARELLRAGRDALQPSEADRARSLAALHSELGDAALQSGDGAAATAASGKSAGVIAASLLVVGAAVTAWLVFRAPDPAPMPGTDPRPTAPSAFVVPSSEPARSQPAPLAPAVTDDKVVPPTTSSVKNSDHLAEEVAILARAAAHLNGGRNTEALGELEEHRRRFPAGMLTEERRGARARALCALGRREEAEQELARMARSSARSPHLVRARQFCGQSPKP